MQRFDDLVNQYRGMADGLPPTALDDLSGAFSEHDGMASAKIQELTVENAKLQQELDSTKAANYDYYMASQQLAPAPANTPNPNDGEKKERPSDLISVEDK